MSALRRTDPRLYGRILATGLSGDIIAHVRTMMAPALAAIEFPAEIPLLRDATGEELKTWAALHHGPGMAIRNLLRERVVSWSDRDLDLAWLYVAHRAAATTEGANNYARN